MRRWLGWLGVLLLGIALSCGALLLACPQAWTVLRLARAPKPTQLPVPVEGVAARSLADSWHAPRSGGRQHQGIDIFARKGRR